MFYRCYFLFSCRPCHSKWWTGSQRGSLRRINTVDEKNTTAKNLVNFGQRTLPWQPILWRETAKIDTPSFHFVRWHSTTVGTWEDRKTYTYTG